MKMLVYAADVTQGKRLLDAVQLFSDKSQLEYHTTLDSLQQRLRRNGLVNVIALLMASSRRELQRVQRLSGLMADMKIILVLPDRSRETTSLGHALYPRFISYADSDFNDVRAVLAKLIQRTDQEIFIHKRREVFHG